MNLRSAVNCLYQTIAAVSTILRGAHVEMHTESLFQARAKSTLFYTAGGIAESSSPVCWTPWVTDYATVETYKYEDNV